MARTKDPRLGDPGMVIDIDAYVNHFYIHYKTQTASHLIGVVDNYFNVDRSPAALGEKKLAAAEAQMNAMLAQMQQQTPTASNVYKIIQEITQGQLLEQTLQSIADTMNTSIEREYGRQYSDTINSVQSTYNKALENGNMGTSQAISFFNEIKKALSLIGENFSNSELQSFQTLRRVFSGKTEWNKDLVPVSKESTTIAAQIIKYLNSAAEKWSEKGELSSQSFASTITQIFSTAIGEELSRQMIQTALWDIENQSDDIVVNALTNIASKNNATVTASGKDFYKDKKGQKRTSKADLITGNVFSLSTMINGQNLTIEVSTNTSVKWQQKKSHSIHIVSGFPIQTAFEGLDANGQQVAYNVIAHRYSPNYPTGSTTSRKGNFYQAYNKIRASIAGTFFTEWLTGSGSVLNSGRIDKAQFLMYNGRIYSVMSIINRICKQLEEGKNPVGVEFRGLKNIDNSFMGADVTKEDMDPYWANKRSDAVRKAINMLTITGSLNPNILKGL